MKSSRKHVTGVAALVSVLWLIAAPVASESRFGDVRLVIAKHREGLRTAHFDETKGVFISDPQSRQLRFEDGSQTLLDVPFDRLTALHYESSGYPRRSFRRSGAYLTIHYVDAAGAARSEILRLSSPGEKPLLAALERDTGLRIDRSAALTSFLGLPIQVFDGDTIIVTDDNGRKTKGMLDRVTASSIGVDGAASFDANRVRSVDVTDPIADGLVMGVLLAVLPAVVVSVNQCANACTLWYPLTPAGWGLVGAGATVGALIDAAIVRNAYQRPGTHDIARLHWTSVLTGSACGIRLSVRF